MMTYYRKSTDVVAYIYRAEPLCPNCVIQALPIGDGGEFDGWALAEGVRMSTEENLSELALAFGIDRDDESSFDSDEFPKVVFDSQLEAGDACGMCNDTL